MKKSSSFGLTARFISWFLFISLIPVMIVGYLSYKSSSEALEKEALVELNAVHTAIASHLATYFQGHTDLVTSFSRSTVFETGLSNANKTDLVQAEVERMAQEDADLYSVLVLDKEGKIVAANDEKEIGLDKSQNPYFVNAQKQPYLKDIYLSDATGKFGYTISAPIGLDQGALAGVVVVRYKLDSLNRILDEADSQLGDTADVYLVNSDKFVISDTLLGQKDAILKKKIDTAGVDQCLSGKEVSGNFQDYRNQEVLGSYGTDLQKSVGKKWCLVTEIDHAEVDIPVVALRNQILQIAGIIFIVVLVLSFIASTSVGNYIRKPIKAVIEQLIVAAGQLSSSSQQTAASSQQNSSISQQVASGATQQSHQAEEISKTISQMAAALQQMSASAKDIALASSQAANTAQNAGQSGEKSQTSISTIKTVISGTAITVKGLAEKSASIGNIVETITNIAEQTNLLALNAAIEAARAGDAGRGFAVVADEVRKLAESSREASGEIKEIIKSMEATIDETVTSTEEGTKSVEEGAKVIEDTLSGVQTISSSIQQLSAKIQEVTSSIEQQAAAVQQVAKTMDSIAAVSEQNSGGAQQLSASTQQLSAANQQVATTAQQIQSLAGDMEKLVGKVNQAKTVIVTKKIEVKPEVKKEETKPAESEKPKTMVKKIVEEEVHAI